MGKSVRDSSLTQTYAWIITWKINFETQNTCTLLCKSLFIIYVQLLSNALRLYKSSFVTVWLRKKIYIRETNFSKSNLER